jgi:tetratricopeptide (TPR) repeat protein
VAAANESLLGYAYLLTGRLARALPLLEDAAEGLSSRMGGASLAMIYLAEGYLRAGRHTDARAMTDRVLAIAVERGERGHQGWALRMRAQIAAQGNPTDVGAAMASYREALALATELEMKPLRAQCHQALGRFYQRAGRHEEARVQLAAGADLFRAMEVSERLPPSETALPASGW